MDINDISKANHFLTQIKKHEEDLKKLDESKESYFQEIVFGDGDRYHERVTINNKEAFLKLVEAEKNWIVNEIKDLKIKIKEL